MSKYLASFKIRWTVDGYVQSLFLISVILSVVFVLSHSLSFQIKFLVVHL